MEQSKTSVSVTASSIQSLLDRLENQTSNGVRSKPKFGAVGIFWDIENCHVPKDVSALAVIEFVRRKFSHKDREDQFVVVCDVIKTKSQILDELHSAGVDVIHTSSGNKNTADVKLRTRMRKFVDRHDSSATVVLISGDGNFAPDIKDFKYKEHMKVVLIHSKTCPEMLLNSSEHYDYEEIKKRLPKIPVDTDPPCQY